MGTKIIGGTISRLQISLVAKMSYSSTCGTPRTKHSSKRLFSSSKRTGYTEYNKPQHTFGEKQRSAKYTFKEDMELTSSS